MFLHKPVLFRVKYDGESKTKLNSSLCLFFHFPELKAQLIARSSQVDDIEHLKTEFSEQKREIKELHEVELENLRKYDDITTHLVSHPKLGPCLSHLLCLHFSTAVSVFTLKVTRL